MAGGGRGTKKRRRKTAGSAAGDGTAWPKRPTGAYLLFLQDFRRGFLQARPGAKVTSREIASAAGAAWRVLAPDLRQQYEEQGQAEKAAYAKAKAAAAAASLAAAQAQSQISDGASPPGPAAGLWALTPAGNPPAGPPVPPPPQAQHGATAAAAAQAACVPALAFASDPANMHAQQQQQQQQQQAGCPQEAPAVSWHGSFSAPLQRVRSVGSTSGIQDTPEGTAPTTFAATVTATVSPSHSPGAPCGSPAAVSHPAPLALPCSPYSPTAAAGLQAAWHPQQAPAQPQQQHQQLHQQQHHQLHHQQQHQHQQHVCHQWSSQWPMTAVPSTGMPEMGPTPIHAVQVAPQLATASVQPDQVHWANPAPGLQFPQHHQQQHHHHQQQQQSQLQQQQLLPALHVAAANPTNAAAVLEATPGTQPTAHRSSGFPLFVQECRSAYGLLFCGADPSLPHTVLAAAQVWQRLQPQERAVQSIRQAQAQASHPELGMSDLLEGLEQHLVRLAAAAAAAPGTPSGPGLGTAPADAAHLQQLHQLLEALLAADAGPPPALLGLEQVSPAAQDAALQAAKLALVSVGNARRPAAVPVVPAVPAAAAGAPTALWQVAPALQAASGALPVAPQTAIEQLLLDAGGPAAGDAGCEQAGRGVIGSVPAALSLLPFAQGF